MNKSKPKTVFQRYVIAAKSRRFSIFYTQNGKPRVKTLDLGESEFAIIQAIFEGLLSEEPTSKKRGKR